LPHRFDPTMEKRGRDEDAKARERRAILKAAAAVITEKGFARTRAEDVAAKAGVPLDAFHGHFPTWERSFARSPTASSSR
jgi:AcrR family transcriptional regulator